MSQVCPYCRTEVPAEEASNVFCSVCSTPHHGDCWLENGGCTLFGCANAPPDEPKVQVTTNDVVYAPGAPAPVFGVAPTSTGFGDVSAVRLAPVAPRISTPPPPPPSRSGVLAPSATIVTQAPANSTGYIAPGSIFSESTSQPAKSRIAFVMLGIFLGGLGIHNFYAGYIWRGVLQLLISVATLGYAAVISWIWAIVEVCTVDRDANNNVFV